MTASINAANFLMLSTFGIAAVGYLLGRITIKGISLGTAGVFVIALVYGAFFGTHFNSRFVIEEINYASQALKIIENLGLVFFVTSVGFIAGPNFFKNMKHNFKSYVLLGVVIILSGGLTAILCLLVGRAIESGQPGYDPGQLTAMISGLLAGSLTSTPAFSATKEAVAAQYQDAVTVGYGIAYLFGVIGVVLFVQLMPRVVHADLDEERRKITHVETGDVVQMIICDLANDKPLGSVYIRDIDRHHNKAEYGIFIGEADARGRGVGTAAAKLMLRYCFEEEQLHRVYLRALSENGQAIRSYEKAGFRREGLLRDDVCIEGDYRDIVWMAAVNSGNDQENEE